jgi:hypothetical protein
MIIYNYAPHNEFWHLHFESLLNSYRTGLVKHPKLMMKDIKPVAPGQSDVPFYPK